MAFEIPALAPLPRLLAGHAGPGAARHRLLWAYDARLADIVRTTREPMVGQMRLTWWHDVITDADGAKGRGDPLVDAMRADGVMAPAGDALLRMIDGWEMLLDPMPLDDTALRGFAEGRGGGLFAALAGEASAQVARAGALWALWDVSGHVGDDVTAKRAVALARAYADGDERWPKGTSALRIAAGLARRDVRRGQRGPAAMTPRLYARFLGIALIGR